MTVDLRLANALAEFERLAAISPTALTPDERRRLEASIRTIERLG